jgi:uncharacterized phage protein (TIGR02220 family)
MKQPKELLERWLHYSHYIVAKSPELDQLLADTKEAVKVEHGTPEQLVYVMNEMLGRRFKATPKVKSQFKARLKDGYTLAEMQTAVENYRASDLTDNRYLTPEFITNPNKLEKWLNATPTKVKSKTQEALEW